jgi:hypothetical protein
MSADIAAITGLITAVTALIAAVLSVINNKHIKNVNTKTEAVKADTETIINGYSKLTQGNPDASSH